MDAAKEKGMSKMRFLIVHPDRGVYLGGGVWAKDEDAKTKNCAPTYPHGTDLTSYLPGSEMVMVFPTLPGQNASKRDVANALQPTW